MPLSGGTYLGTVPFVLRFLPFFTMKHTVRTYALALLLPLSVGVSAFAEETAEPMMAEETPVDQPTEEPGLRLGSLYRLQMQHCPRLLNMEEWKACRKKRLEYRSTILDERRKTRSDYTKDQASERSDGTERPAKKVLPKDFVDFSRHYRNYDYLKESPRTTENHMRFRAKRLEQRVKHGGAGQHSRMMEDDSEDAEDGEDAE